MDVPDELIPIVAILSLFGFLTISSLAHYGCKACSVWRLSRLKERLVEAGMTSPEIERVVNAGTPRESQQTIQQKKFA